MTEDCLDLYELQLQLKESLEETFPEQVWVRAELASVQARANGHCYLELSQSDGTAIVAKARAVIWKSRYYALVSYFREVTGSDLKPGMDVMLRVEVSYSEVYGLTLVVSEIEPQFTLGQAELEKRRTIETLEKEGLMELQKELALPAIPYRLAVVSARDAAGFGDFRKHLCENPYGYAFEVDLFEASMQGTDAPASIAAALECAGSGYDAVLILRGGGSVLDLACFDDFGLCKAIALCPTPVITAIGHDRDYHVADMVASSFVKTPTALADLFIDAFAAEDERLAGIEQRLRLAFEERVSTMENQLLLLRSGIILAALGKVGNQEARLASLASRIMAADPRQLLSRGYTLATDSRGVVLKSAGGLAVGDPVSVRFADGTLDCTIDKISYS